MTSNQITACPDCSGAKVYERTSPSTPDRERWRCSDCGATFPSPTTRETNNLGGWAAARSRALSEVDDA